MIKQDALNRLIQSIQLLAADYPVQLNALPEFVHKPDEVALIFNDSYLLVQQLKETQILNEFQLAKLNEIDELLEGMSTISRFWTLDSMRNDDQWREVRVQAMEMLDLLDQTKQEPNLYWVKFTK